MQRGGTVAQRDRVLRARVLGKGALELDHFRPRRQPIGTQHRDHGLDVRVVDGLPAIGQGFLADGHAAFDGEFFQNERVTVVRAGP